MQDSSTHLTLNMRDFFSCQHLCSTFDYSAKKYNRWNEPQRRWEPTIPLHFQMRRAFETSRSSIACLVDHTLPFVFLPSKIREFIKFPKFTVLNVIKLILIFPLCPVVAVVSFCWLYSTLIFQFQLYCTSQILCRLRFPELRHRIVHTKPTTSSCYRSHLGGYSEMKEKLQEAKVPDQQTTIIGPTFVLWMTYSFSSAWAVPKLELLIYFPT